MNTAEISQVNQEFTKVRANTIFQRGLKKDEVPASLDTFEVVKVIEEGISQNVFLVQKKDTKAVYAMKSLRKDVILDYD